MHHVRLCWRAECRYGLAAGTRRGKLGATATPARGAGAGAAASQLQSGGAAAAGRPLGKLKSKFPALLYREQPLLPSPSPRLDVHSRAIRAYLRSRPAGRETRVSPIRSHDRYAVDGRALLYAHASPLRAMARCCSLDCGPAGWEGGAFSHPARGAEAHLLRSVGAGCGVPWRAVAGFGAAWAGWRRAAVKIGSQLASSLTGRTGLAGPGGTQGAGGGGLHAVAAAPCARGWD